VIGGGGARIVKHGLFVASHEYTHAESRSILGKAQESVSHINCTLLIRFHPENMMYFIIHNDTYRRNILGVHLSLPLKFGKYILYTVFNY
jgi:hypothetical protein